VCGLPTNAFSFFGFPPNRKAARRALFCRLAERPETLVFFESPRRIVDALGDALGIFGERECALGREMTKPHEEFLFGPLSWVVSELSARAKVLGEVVWGVRGAEARAGEPASESFQDAARRALEEGVSPKAAAKDLARRFRVSTKAAYAALMADKARPRA
jgi:16S rRNA (cytidine1402-2'-O)-methyltransferase